VIPVSDQPYKKVLEKGNVALAEGAIQAGLRCYFGYPITPQNEIPEYLSKRLPEVGGTFLQAESEVASINMVLGATAVGVRAMTTSSSPGISLMQEGISFIAGCQLPAVIVNVQRSGPGLGGIKATQSDYFQATRGGGHGDYRTMVLAPGNVQEMFDFAALAFELAEKYRNPVMILADATLGQMKEGVILHHRNPIVQREKSYALTGSRGRTAHCVRSMYLEGDEQELLNRTLAVKYDLIQRDEQRHVGYWLDDAEIVIVAYGTASRISLSAARTAREEGIKVGLFRPTTLWPFPGAALRALSDRVKKALVVEMSLGQMVEDVQRFVHEDVDVRLFGRAGGGCQTPGEVLAKIKEF
jgi:2-oxoglutarate ferredoxin oxidoreductase subunit alpha